MMTSASSTTSAKLFLSLLIAFNAAPVCEATGAIGLGAHWTPFQTRIKSPDDTCDTSSFMFAGTELHRSPSSSMGAVATEDPKEAAQAVEEVPPEVTDESDWETTFAAGVY